MNEPANTEKMVETIQQSGIIPMGHAREAIHIGIDDLPFIGTPDGASIQVLHIDLNQNLWILRTNFPAGYQVDTHYHTGPVFAVTEQGQWFYKEYPDYVNKAGSYLFEPAHSIHTLMVPEDCPEDTIVWFAIYGSNVNVDENGNVTGIVDAKGVLESYRALCAAEGKSCDKLIVIGE